MVKYICVQPRLVYYAWQLEVMINNFLKNGITPNDIHILIGYSTIQSDLTNHPDVVNLYSKLMSRYGNVNFYFYKDTRINPNYISSIRPNILKQHFKNFPELSNTVIFYHDCDMLFTRKPDFSKFLANDTWYMSDTIGYIGSRYILSKGVDIYNKMCDIVGIDNRIPKLMESNSGGAQYLMKGVTSDYWEKVERDSESLYRFLMLDEEERLIKNPGYHPIQKWTSDMWAVLWNAWYFGHETRVDDYFKFTWATDSIDKWNDNLIYHNAGVVESGDLFYKGSYINSLPYNIENTFSPKYASYKYVEEILDAKRGSLLIR